MRSISTQALIAKIGHAVAKWTAVHGATVVHNDLGMGTIVEVVLRAESPQVELKISFAPLRASCLVNELVLRGYTEIRFSEESWLVVKRDLSDNIGSEATLTSRLPQEPGVFHIRRLMRPDNPVSIALFKCVYYIFDADNTESVAKHGLLSRRNVNALKLKHADISDSEVQKRREAREPVYNRLIHEYVPLYFNPRNPMLYRLQNQRSKLIIVEIPIDLLLAYDHVFTDGNAASSGTKFGNTIETAKTAIEVLNAGSWNDLPDGKRKRCAEILVYNRVPATLFSKAMCYSEEQIKTARSHLRCRVEHLSSVFF